MKRNRARRQNPLQELKTPWNVSREEAVSEVTWGAVLDTLASERAELQRLRARDDGPSYGVAVELHFPNDLRSGEADVTVYIVERGRFFEHFYLEDVQRKELQTDMRSNIEWTKENASVIYSGNTRPEDRLRPDNAGWTWQGLLQMFYDGVDQNGVADFWHRMNPTVPVIIEDDIVPLNEARLLPYIERPFKNGTFSNPAEGSELDIYRRVLSIGQAQIMYLRENEDAFDDPKQIGLADECMHAITTGNRYVVGQNGHGMTSYGDGSSHSARTRLLNLINVVREHSKHDYADLLKEIRHELAFPTGYLMNLMSTSQKKNIDGDREFVFYRYESEDLVTIDLEDYGEENSITGALNSMTEEQTATIADSIERWWYIIDPEKHTVEDAEMELVWDDNTWALVLTVNAVWQQSIDVDALTEWAHENLRCLQPEDDEDEPEEPEENPASTLVHEVFKDEYGNKLGIVESYVGRAADFADQDSLGRMLAWWFPADMKCAWVDWIHVEARGSGLGTRIMKRVLARAREEGAQVVGLVAVAQGDQAGDKDADLKLAKGFYEKFGFKVDKKFSKYSGLDSPFMLLFLDELEENPIARRGPRLEGKTPYVSQKRVLAAVLNKVADGNHFVEDIKDESWDWSLQTTRKALNELTDYGLLSVEKVPFEGKHGGGPRYLYRATPLGVSRIRR